MARRRPQRAPQFKITMSPVVAKPRVLKAKWSMDSEDSLRKAFSGGANRAQVANVMIEIGLPPMIYDWLLLNSVEFVQRTMKPLARRRVSGKHYYVLPMRHADLWQVSTWSGFQPSLPRRPKQDDKAAKAWFDVALDILNEISFMDDVVSLAPFCAKLVVAPEQVKCAWRKKKAK